ncbi:MAG: hypothetical protein QM802_21235 [Agriterribacter sp.]
MKLKTPHHLLLLIAILTYIAGLFQNEHTFDLHVSDTYYVIGRNLLVPLLLAIPLMFWLIYIITWKYLFSKKRSWIHVFPTIASILFIVSFFLFPGKYYNSLSDAPGRYYNYNDWYGERISPGIKLLIVSIVLLIIAQGVFLVNLSRGIYRYSHSKV